MRRLLLSGLLLLASLAGAQAQCISVSGAGGPAPQFGITCPSDPTVPTYAATGIGIVPGASATDIACLTGSATKTVRVQAVRVSGTGTAITIPIILKKNASADTGGTPAVTTALPVPYPLDSSNPTVSATAISYTAPPTINDATPGVIDAGNLFLAATTTSTAMPYVLFDYSGHRYSQAPMLRGIAQQLCVNLNATSPTALININFRWTELAQ